MNSVAITKTAPIITGRSKVFNASTISFSQTVPSKMYSTNTAPANIEANQPETAVTTSWANFFNACFLMMRANDNPWP